MSRPNAEAKNFYIPCTGDIDTEMVPVSVANPLPVAAGTGAGGAYTDRSVANATGATQQLMAANANRKVLGIQNNAANPIAVNFLGGAAALNTAGSVTLSPGQLLLLDNYPPVGVVNLIGTLNDDVTAWEG